MEAASLIPPNLRKPLQGDQGPVVARVVLNLTVYLRDVSEEDLLRLLDIYHQFCPDDRRVLYTIAEWHGWAPVNSPRVTNSVTAAFASRSRRPALAPVIRRIREGRGLELRFWDGHEIENEAGSWSFACQKVLRRGREPFCPITFSLPLLEDPTLLLKLAHDVAAVIPFISGHGGLAFTYHPYYKIDAFKIIYALARRFWGIDVEDLNASVRSTGEFVKTISWLTLLGRNSFAVAISGIDDLTEDGTITLHDLRHGIVVGIGPAPDPLDINRPITDAYFRLGRRLEPVLPTQHPAFEGVRFGTDASTVRWMRRFAEPDAWGP